MIAMYVVNNLMGIVLLLSITRPFPRSLHVKDKLQQILSWTASCRQNVRLYPLYSLLPVVV